MNSAQQFMAEGLGEFLNAIILALVTAFIAVRLALRRFRTETWWDLKTG